jgi:hypothetical protein
VTTSDTFVPSPKPAASLPPLEEVRGISAESNVDPETFSSDLLITGKDFVAYSGGYLDPGGDLILPNPGPDSTAYGIFGFHLTPDQNVTGLTVETDTSLPSGYWVSLSNYAAGRWKHFGPYKASNQAPSIAAADWPHYISPACNVYVALLVPGLGNGGQLSVKSARLHIYDAALPPLVPYGLVATQGDHDAYIRLTFSGDPGDAATAASYPFMIYARAVPTSTGEPATPYYSYIYSLAGTVGDFAVSPNVRSGFKYDFEIWRILPNGALVRSGNAIGWTTGN